MARKQGLLGIFVYVDDFLTALRGLRAEACIIDTVFSPLNVPEVQEILEKKPSSVRLITLIGGISGGLGVVGLAVYAHLSFNLITSGKPVLPWVPWVIVWFEGTILGAVLFAVAAWILMGRLPRLHPPAGYDAAFSHDRFGVLVTYTGEDEAKVKKILEDAGAKEVRDVAW